MGGALPQTTPDQRSPCYADTETLITTGFLTHTIEVGGIRVALRSLCPGDLFLLQSRVGGKDTEEWKVWALATSIWLLDGYSLLGEANAVPRLRQTVSRLPKGSQDILYSVMLGLFLRQTRAIHMVEAYSYESESRFKWNAMKGQLSGGNMAGIPGANRLGLNHIQQVWSFYNEYEDRRVRDEAMWEGFKLTTSPHAPAGIKKIDARDQQHRENERARRQAVMDRCFYEAVGVLKPLKKGEKDTNEARPRSQTKSADDLADEMHRWVTGQDDDHDRLVKSYKQRIITQYEEEKREREARLAALQRKQAELEEDLGPPRLVAYTSDQLADVLKTRQPGRSGARTVQDGPPVRDYLYSRYLERAPDAGVLQSEDGVLVPSNTPPPGTDLMQLITERQVQFKTEGET